MVRDDDDNRNEQGETITKSLRFSDPDVTIIVKYIDEKGEETEKEYSMYAQVLANLSNFFDTGLAVEMREKTTRVIALQDVTPKDLEMALKFQLDPIAVHSMTYFDAIKLVAFYHVYEFTGGLKLCDHVLSQVVKGWTNFPDDAVVNALLMADQYQLTKTEAAAIESLKILLKNRPREFTVEQMKKLHPMFQKGLFLSAIPRGMTKEEVDSPLFPKLFVSHWKSPHPPKKSFGSTKPQPIRGSTFHR